MIGMLANNGFPLEGTPKIQQSDNLFSETRPERDELIQAYFNSGKFDLLVERYSEILKTIVQKQKDPSYPIRLTRLRARGEMFEELALIALSREGVIYPELEQFILEAVKDVRLWIVEAEDVEDLSPEEQDLFEEYKTLATTMSTQRQMPNNDAIAIELVDDMASGKTVARITGVIEVKNHRPKQGRDIRQYESSRKALYESISKFSRFYPLLVKLLDLQGYNFPDVLEIVPEDELSFVYVLPENLSIPREIAGKPNTYEQHIPISNDEFEVLAGYLLEKISVGFGEEVASVLRGDSGETGDLLEKDRFLH